MGKKVDGRLTQGLVYSPEAYGPVAELGADNSLLARFIYGQGSNVPDYMVKGSNTYRIITDHLGSVVMVTDAETGAVAQEITYGPFGEVLSDSNPGFQPFGFAGGIYDEDTGLVHFGAREYDAELGRWTASDPIGFGGGDSNLYGYVLGDPVNLVDPSGLYGLRDVLYDAKHPGQTLDALKVAVGDTAATLKDALTFWNTDCTCSGRSVGRKTWDNFKETNRTIWGAAAPTGMTLLISGKIAEQIGAQTPLKWIVRGAPLSEIRGVVSVVGRAQVAAGTAFETGVGIGSWLRAKYGPCEQ